MSNFNPNKLKEQWAYYFDIANYKQIKKQCDEKVIEWKWGNQMMFDPTPFWFECYGQKKPKWLKDGKEPNQNDMLHGINSKGDVVYVQDPWFCGQYDKEKMAEYFCLYEDSNIIIVRYGYGKDRTPDIMWLFETQNDQVVKKHSFRNNGGFEEHYSWLNNTLQSKSVYTWNHELYMPGSIEWKGIKKSWCSTFNYEYESTGELNIIFTQQLEDNNPVGKSRVYYRKPRKGETLKALAPMIENVLLEEIPKKLKENKVKEKIYSLILQYTAEDFEWIVPPVLVLVKQNYRETLLSERPKEAGYLLWSPDEIPEEDKFIFELENNELIDLCRVFTELMSYASSINAGRKLLHQTASKLTLLDWNDILSTTEDFVITPIDNTGEYIPEKDIKASISNEKLLKLKKDGYL